MEEERYMGYTLLEAAAEAVDNGGIGAWEWFQAWFKAELEESDPPLKEW